jgi:hypothetical protein
MAAATSNGRSCSCEILAAIIRLKPKALSMTLVQIISSINDNLRMQLEKYHCVRGQLKYQAPSMVSLTGIRADEKPIMIWQTEPQLSYFLSLYVDQEPGSGGVTIAIDLKNNQFKYATVTVSAIKQEAGIQEDLRKQDDEHRKQEMRKHLAQQTDKYGLVLAERVADALLSNSLGYGHRDYCGMGLEYREGTWYYGELWDGYMAEPLLKWSSKSAFISWLTIQSDASLARLEAKESFYWGNQTITRERLKALAGYI